MAITKEDTLKIIETFGKNAQDTGSPEVQISILTKRIQDLTDHLKRLKKDSNSRRGLLKLIGRRRKMLKYLQRKDFNRYQEVIKKLELRK